MNLNPFRAFGILRVLRRIADALDRANVLKQAELDGLQIPYPPAKPAQGDVAIEISYTDAEQQDLEEFLVKTGQKPHEEEPE